MQYIFSHSMLGCSLSIAADPSSSAFIQSGMVVNASMAFMVLSIPRISLSLLVLWLSLEANPQRTTVVKDFMLY